MTDSIRVQALVVCDHMVQEAQGGKYSAIGIFQAITVPGFPALYNGFWVYAKLTGPPSRQFTASFFFSGPSGRRQLWPEIELTFGPTGFFEMSGRFAFFELKAPGVHEVEVWINGEERAKCQVLVQAAGGAEPLTSGTVQ